LLDVEPEIVDFCGYGEGKAGIVLENIRYSGSVNEYIGMWQAIQNNIAISFTARFYQGLGAGQLIEGEFDNVIKQLDAAFGRRWRYES
jgi:hypothetical protein